MRCVDSYKPRLDLKMDILIPSITLPAMSDLPSPFLDHSAFPHIIDNIFAFADRASLFALRTASRAFRTAADAQLANHLVCRWASVETPAGRHPALADIHARVCELPADATVRGAPVPWASSPPLASSRHTPRLSPSVSGPAVVDFGDMFTPRSISLLPAHTQILRVWLSGFMHNPAITTPSDTVIVFGWPQTPSIGTVYEPWIALRPTTKRVVYHISTRYRAHSELLAQLRSSASGVEELTIIVNDTLPLPKPWECAPLLHLLRCVVAAARRRPQMRVSFVNAAGLPQLFPSDGSVVFGDDAVAPFVSSFHEYVRGIMGDGDGSKVAEQWRFTTLKEHRAEVGERQFVLEMGGV
ncbi:hypothetical protein CC85DRAFT_201077 [Cutaneotrichosporon oleaginosum]|uniref:F-box domain-containing protein n=1 Tax=Cutaneotrichosporon oleaginosum TaxID=879819 RepID=A0A0J0XU82_9TREE|nr:uncharacterized protein CC85DRAFT_201077 [Cutaneotrichosporon oleaginosum]KLT44651.1 hypothetical protein CC85DRAFT_201077 [Cutaneotrichosporon oleaginosum]TXT07638.1 hypothetical protein COLE_04562 [Cutaneotrichosporon oleaginosum]